jgi:hypothetical protein
MNSPYDLKDYAYPSMMAEKAIHDGHLAMLNGNYDEAIRHTTTALVECSRLLDAIITMKERGDALRQQASTV